MLGLHHIGGERDSIAGWSFQYKGADVTAPTMFIATLKVTSISATAMIAERRSAVSR